MQSHVDVDSPPTGSDTPRKTRRVCVPKACQHCARSKQRCDGANPCARCQSRNRSCLYATDDRRNPDSFQDFRAPASDTGEVFDGFSSSGLPNQIATINRTEVSAAKLTRVCSCQSLKWETRKNSYIKAQTQAQMPETISKLLSGTKMASNWSWIRYFAHQVNGPPPWLMKRACELSLSRNMHRMKDVKKPGIVLSMQK
ncbi:hypothetical protein CaCOL14_011633 [Colletotrichum acutatum]